MDPIIEVAVMFVGALMFPLGLCVIVAWNEKREHRRASRPHPAE